MGCVTNAQKRGGHCFAHKKKVACAHPNCNTPLVDGKGVCVKHGAHGICTAWGCKTNAASGKKGHCFRHSKDKATCSASDCSNGVVARGLCYAHGARGFCSTGGCNSGAVKDGLCEKHGANGFCTHGAFGWCKVDGCTTPARQGFEHCVAHGGGKKKKPCSVAGCTTTSSARGLCGKHGGGNGECLIAGCTNRMYGFLKTCRKHGGSGYCQHPSGCIGPATKYGANCTKHTKMEKKD
eukprot:gene33009-biopygen27662